MFRIVVPAVAHIPVLLAEVMTAARDRHRAVDATGGGGGHVQGFLTAGMQVLAIDRDPDAIRALDQLHGGRVELLHASFAEERAWQQIRAFAPDFVLLDLGVSSAQLDEVDRGFTFRPNVRLDMRLSQTGPTAADLLNTLSQDELWHVFRVYGDEPRAGSMAREVVKRRATAPYRLSDDLVNTIRAVLGPRSGPSDFARLFQAVRIAVNDELGALQAALPNLRDALVPGGKLAVISYHSGEDRLVKTAFRDWSQDCICPPEAPICQCRGQRLGERVTKKPIRPSPVEVQSNPRARSARMRLFMRAVD
jgi:16S rRNA (cytosine1402-N4)-methyltransferase